jgi:hypothetical protein
MGHIAKLFLGFVKNLFDLRFVSYNKPFLAGLFGRNPSLDADLMYLNHSKTRSIYEHVVPDYPDLNY